MEWLNKTEAGLVWVYGNGHAKGQAVRALIGSEVIIERMVFLYDENEVLNLAAPTLREDGSNQRKAESADQQDYNCK
jgi:hypothetical protein